MKVHRCTYFWGRECSDLGVGGWVSFNPNVVRICKSVRNIGRSLRNRPLNRMFFLFALHANTGLSTHPPTPYLHSSEGKHFRVPFCNPPTHRCLLFMQIEKKTSNLMDDPLLGIGPAVRTQQVELEWGARKSNSTRINIRT